MSRHPTIRLVFCLYVSLLASRSIVYAAPIRLLASAAGSSSGIVITDNGAGDVNPTLGIVTWSGDLGRGFAVTVTTGTSTPVSAPNELILNSFSVQSSGVGTMAILLENSGFTAGPDGPFSVFGEASGITSASTGSAFASFQTWVNASNLVLDFGPDVPTPGPIGDDDLPAGSVAAWSAFITFPTGAFSSTSSAPFTKSGPYSLFSAVALNFTAAGTANVQLTTRAVPTPEPTSLLLLVSGVASLILLAPRMRTIRQKNRAFQWQSCAATAAQDPRGSRSWEGPTERRNRRGEVGAGSDIGHRKDSSRPKADCFSDPQSSIP